MNYCCSVVRLTRKANRLKNDDSHCSEIIYPDNYFLVYNNNTKKYNYLASLSDDRSYFVNLAIIVPCLGINFEPICFVC